MYITLSLVFLIFGENHRYDSGDFRSPKEKELDMIIEENEVISPKLKENSLYKALMEQPKEEEMEVRVFMSELNELTDSYDSPTFGSPKRKDKR